MEKVRLAVQTIGQMLFAQCTEIINPRLNYGLPPNLVVDEPSQSFLLKPVDVMIAALQSELGFLSNPAGTHVQSAEMGNQALNSLGLISARYTHMALDVLSQLASAHIFTLCQALDLRAMHCKFLKAVEPTIKSITLETLDNILDDSTAVDTETSQTLPYYHQLKCDWADLHTLLWKGFIKQLDQTTTMDSAQRFVTIFVSLQSTIISQISQSSSKTIPAIKEWTQRCSASALETFLRNRNSYHACPDASPLLGTASGRMYNFVRKELGVPFLRTSLIRDGGSCENDALGRDGESIGVTEGGVSVDRFETSVTTGELITTIYQSIRTGALYGPVMECLGHVEHNG